MRKSSLYSIFFPLTTVHASLPAATVIAEALLHEVAAPEPTPWLHILERQSESLNTVCGYEEGNSASPMVCNSGQVCGYNEGYHWWGCCGGATLSASQWVPTACPVQTSCVDSSSVDSCGSSCLANTMIRKCSNADFPYCATSTLTDDFLSVFNCATAPEHVIFGASFAVSYTPPPTTSSTSTPGTSAVPNPLVNPAALSTTASTTTPAVETPVVTTVRSTPTTTAPSKVTVTVTSNVGSSLQNGVFGNLLVALAAWAFDIVLF